MCNNNLKQQLPAEPYEYGRDEDFDEQGQQNNFEFVESTPQQLLAQASLKQRIDKAMCMKILSV